MSLSERYGRRKPLLLGVLGLWLGWEIVSHSFAAYLATVDPAAALRLRPTEVAALIAEADLVLNAALNKGRTSEAAASGAAEEVAQDSGVMQWADFARKAFNAQASNTSGAPVSPDIAALDAATRTRVHTLAQRALASDPLNARAMRILSQVANEDSVDKLMQAAVRRSVRESIAVYWLMQERAKHGDHAAAVHYADVLMRTRANALPLALPTLVRAAESDGAGSLKEVLAANPPWRSPALAEITRCVRDPRTPLDLLLSLRDTANPPTTGDLSRYIWHLIEGRHYALAYYTWLQFLPPERLRAAGYLFNGNFENAPSGLPFDWTFKAGPGVTVDFAARLDEERQHALYVEFGAGRAEFGGVRQLLMLPAGRYQLTGKYRGSVRGRRGLVWKVSCLGDGWRGAELGASAMMLGAAPTWQRFEVSITVPETGCPMQRLELRLDARSTSEQLVAGSIWYDDLTIERSGHEMTANPL